MTDSKIEDLIGKTVAAVEGMDEGSEQITFRCTDGSVYRMTYYQDCCASCSVEDVCGDAADLLGSPVVRAEMPSSLDNFDELKEAQRRDGIVDYTPESYTWTFVIVGTAKGTVTLRWYGASNGYYGESPTFEKVE